MCLSSRLLASFQRFARPASGAVGRAPPSLGALPVGTTEHGEFVLPIEEDEAFWVGVSATQSGPGERVGLGAVVRDGRIFDAVLGGACGPHGPCTRTTVPPSAVVPGIRQATGSGSWVFARAVPEGSPAPACRAVCIRAKNAEGRGAVAYLRLASYEEFVALTGLVRPEPLNPNYGYKGWRLL